MRSHGADAVAAREAVLRRDAEGVRRAGEALARPDPAPGLPDSGRGALERVRVAGERLRTADLGDAPGVLVGMSEACAECHLAFGITAGGADLWTAVVFESEAAWQAGADRPALVAARDWGTRREVLARVWSESPPAPRTP
jgi:hypothetical protein